MREIIPAAPGTVADLEHPDGRVAKNVVVVAWQVRMGGNKEGAMPVFVGSISNSAKVLEIRHPAGAPTVRIVP